MDNQTLEALVKENMALLGQVATLLRGLSGEQYRSSQLDIGCSSIGEHVRHITDHYTCFLEGWALVDYDQRARELLVEQCPDTGGTRLAEVSFVLHQYISSMQDPAEPLAVAHRPDDSHRNRPLTIRSSIGRELTFLANHTLHHMAIIAIVARLLGSRLSADFGVARSTMNYWGPKHEQPPRVNGSCATE